MLIVGSNEVEDRGALIISKALEMNSVLVELKLSHTCSSELFDLIKKACERNKKERGKK